METNDLLNATAEVKAASAYVKEKYEDLEAKYNALESKLVDVEVAGKSWRPHGGPMQTQNNPELAAYLQKGTIPHAETKELSVTQDGQGVSVRSEWSDRIVAKVRETSPVRSVATNMQTSTNALELLVDREQFGSEWIAELDPRTATDSSFMSRHLIPVNEHYALVEATLQMLEDSSLNVEQWMQGKVAERFGRQESTSFMLGDGIGQPRGLQTYTTVPEADFEWGAVPADYTIGATFTGIDGDIVDAQGEHNLDALFNLVDSLKAAYLPGASWMMPRAMRNKIRTVKDSQGRYIYHTSLAADVPDTLLGYPVYLAEDMDTPAADSTGALFGDFAQAYTVVDRLGIDIIRDPYNRPGFVRWYARKRVGGALVNPEAVKALVLGSEPA